MDDPLESIKELNLHLQESDDKRNEGLAKEHPEVERVDNILYGNVEVWHELDIYLPKKRMGKVPTIIHIHGGGWTYGTKEIYQFFGLEFAKNGIGFVNFNYRLPPDVIFPGELDDVNRVMHWVAENGHYYDIDTENIILMGDSAGGQMTLQYLTIMKNPEFRKKFGYTIPNITVRTTILNCAAAFLTLPGVLSFPTKAYFTEDVLINQYDLLDTESYLTSSISPLMITTSNYDMMLEANARLDGYLLAKGIEHEFRIYGDIFNPRYHNFNYDIRDEIAQKCNSDIIAFINKCIDKQ
ncbi:alpha/beta hydrolase [Tuanshanicoccus lijuaniae]|nr:alpha/beta hydrolase [Aerococcaceae bacterium zg-1292]QQA38208.1 alpha/beta hydrolase [Aerococcaceae bacterium zg-1292]